MHNTKQSYTYIHRALLLYQQQQFKLKKLHKIVTFLNVNKIIMVLTTAKLQCPFKNIEKITCIHYVLTEKINQQYIKLKALTVVAKHRN